MPPTGVSMSTCLSPPSFCFFTLTLHAPRRATARIATPKATLLMTRNLVLLMPVSSSYGNFRRTFQPGAALGDIRNRDGQMAANRNFSKERLDGGHFRDRRIGKRTHVILDL